MQDDHPILGHHVAEDRHRALPRHGNEKSRRGFVAVSADDMLDPVSIITDSESE
jgi:hypothetical protein